MSSSLWIPGVPPGPPPSVDEFLKRVHAQIQAFAQECACDEVEVAAQLFDGRTLRLQAILPEPGFGWVTLRPFPEDDEDGVITDDELPLDVVMVPVGSIVRIHLRRPAPGQRFGFSAPASQPAAPDAPPDATAEGLTG
jgi:hypothetical protein